jgi:hypothetical protein
LDEGTLVLRGRLPGITRSFIRNSNFKTGLSPIGILVVLGFVLVLRRASERANFGF